MDIPAPPSPYTDLTIVIRALQGAVWSWFALLGEPLGMRVCQRLSHMVRRMERLAARFQAGLPLQVARRAGVTPRVATEGDGSKSSGARRIWPFQFGWLLALKRHHAAYHTNRIQAVLETPEMVALLIAAPQAALILRPMCRMLAIPISVLRPRAPGAPAEIVPEKIVAKRVRKKRVPLYTGRIPLPRGVLSAARRQGYGKLY